MNGTEWENSDLECSDLSIDIEVFVDSVWKPRPTSKADSE